MPVQRVCRPDHSFRGFQGQVEAGRVSVGDQLTALPSGEHALVKSISIAGKNAAESSVGQPVTIQLDREVDVSRGCVLVKDAGLKLERTFIATLLWMDEENLIPGKEYLLKLGTKLSPAVVTGIQHKVDINSGVLLPAESVGKNEILRCEISLSEPIVLDQFKRHKSWAN